MTGFFIVGKLSKGGFKYIMTDSTKICVLTKNRIIQFKDLAEDVQIQIVLCLRRK